MNFTKVSRLSNFITRDLKRKITVILDPNPEKEYRMFGTAEDVSIGIDADNWVIPEKYRGFISELAQRTDLSNEEKILEVYKRLCEDYTYDDNVLSYIVKNDDESFSLSDAYGRATDDDWKEKRSYHNKRNCFEMSRILAKAITETIKTSKNAGNYDVCIVWDAGVTHYAVGLIGDGYYAKLDLDDFTQIKDLTRMKTNLTLDGITVYEDKSDKLGSVVRRFNKNRNSDALTSIEDTIDQKKENPEKRKEEETSVSNDFNFIKHTIQILKEDYKLDPQGIYEYLKEIVDTKFGTRFRKKIWVEIKGNPGKGKIYTRGLIITIGDEKYVIDVTKESTEEMFHKFETEKDQEPNVIPYNDLRRDWNEDPYDGR